MTQNDQNQPLVTVNVEGNRATLTLNRPERHNALVPELLSDLLQGLETVAETEGLAVLVLQAAGKSFSTGGDVKAFYQQGEAIQDYAAGLVGDLNRAILALMDLEIPVIARLQGPVTGGSLGLVMACDLVAATDRAFVAPYYVEVGFAPDGGWTAMLPERIGESRARSVQLLNRHVTAAEALDWGLFHAVCADEAQLDQQVADWAASLTAKVQGSIQATRRLLRPAEKRQAIEAALEAERQAFLKHVVLPETKEGMRRFARL